MEVYKLYILLVYFYVCVINVSSIYIEKNAYKGISISISDNVNEEDFDIEKLTDVLTKSSELIYHATRKRSYFGEFSIFFPSSWSALSCENVESETRLSQKVDVHLTSSVQTPHLMTKHSRGCGIEGDRIHMPIQWLNEDDDVASLARQFVKQWSIYRYGVFEEKPVIEESCYFFGKSWTPVGCYSNKYYAEPEFKNGLPMCSLPSNFTEIEGLKSSLMSKINSPKVLDFCDGSSFPHNPVMPTLHNALCKGKTVWSVIENSLDFKYGTNFPLKSEKPPKNPVLKCVRENAIEVTFAIQTNTVPSLGPEDMSPIAYTLCEFLRNFAPRNSKMMGVTFSDEKNAQTTFELQITESMELCQKLLFDVRTSSPIDKVCLSCGLQKALDVTINSSSSSPIVAVIAWKSALVGENPSKLVKTIEKYPPYIRLHLILIDDTEVEAVSIELIQLINSLGGLIYYLPKESVFRVSKLLVTLGDVVKNPLKVEDRTIVVHEKRYWNISKNFVDSFRTPSGEFNKMLYAMYCSPKSDIIIYSNNTNCKPPGISDVLAFKCSEVFDFSNKKEPQKKFEYPFSYFSTATLHCSSVAILLPSPSSKKSFTLKGWFSEYVVKVPQNALIIYVEITGFPERKFKVEAQISGPGLKPPFLLELRDNGNGDPDTIAGDGIYSRYFTKLVEKGIYTVTVSAEALMNYADSFYVGENPKQEDRIVQSKPIGFFYVSNPLPKLDTLPPNQIADLRVISVNHENKTAELQWTAPGGDYDFGEAAAYEIKYSQQPSSLSDLFFNEPENFPLQPVKAFNPNSTGEKELMTFQIDQVENSAVYYIALRAMDENNNTGDISNIVQVYFNQSETGTMKSTSSTPTLMSTSPDAENTTNDNITEKTVSITDATEISSTPYNNDTSSPLPPIDDELFDKKTIIILSSSGGILLLIIIINIIICCCCIKKIKSSPEPKKLSRKDSLRPPFNLNIAYQEDNPHSSSNTDEFIGVSTSTLADPNNYSEPEARSKPTSRKYSYHTEKSIQNKTIKDSELGFKIVQTLSAYATSSLSRYGTRSREPDTESETEFKSAVPQPQVSSGIRDAEIYPLGVV